MVGGPQRSRCVNMEVLTAGGRQVFAIGAILQPLLSLPLWRSSHSPQCSFHTAIWEKNVAVLNHLCQTIQSCCETAPLGGRVLNQSLCCSSFQLLCEIKTELFKLCHISLKICLVSKNQQKYFNKKIYFKLCTS